MTIFGGRSYFIFDVTHEQINYGLSMWSFLYCVLYRRLLSFINMERGCTLGDFMSPTAKMREGLLSGHVPYSVRDILTQINLRTGLKCFNVSSKFLTKRLSIGPPLIRNDSY